MKDFKLLGNLYEGLILEFSESAIQKIINKFRKEDEHLSDHVIRGYLERFEKYKGNSKIVKKDPFQYTWKELEHVMDANFPNNISTGSNASKESKEGLKVYEDSKVVVYKASNVKDAILLGNGYSFCISRSMGGNMYIGYRLRAASAFYFVTVKDRDNKKVGDRFNDPAHMIVIDAQNGKYQWTWADNGQQGHGTTDTTIGEMISTVPELKGVLESGVIKNDILSEEEEEKLNMFNAGDFDGLSYSEKEEYIKSGFYKNVDITKLDKNLRNEYLSMGHNINENGLLTLSKAEMERWIKVRSLVVSQMSDEHFAYEFAELLFRKGMEVANIVSNKIGKDAFYSNKYSKLLLNYNKEVPDNIVKGVASSFDTAKEYAANLLKAGKEVPDIVLRGISQRASAAEEFAELLVYKYEKEVPDIILRAICFNSYQSYLFARLLLKIGKEVSDRILTGIAKIHDNAFDYAEELLGKRMEVPEIILHSIATDGDYSFYYAENRIMNGKEVPEIIVNGIANDHNNSYKYALLLSRKGKDVPDVIVNAISEYNAKAYAKFLEKNGKVVPDIIKQKVSKNTPFKLESVYENMRSRLY